MNRLVEQEEVRRAPSPATDAFAGAVRPPHNLESNGWREIPPQELDAFNERLLETDSSVLQYPYWNQPYARLGFHPTFLRWGDSHRPSAYACILAVALGPLRIGLVFRGPVSISTERQVPTAALEDLRDWARSHGYVFLRFTHSNGELLERIAHLGRSQRQDAFPFYEDIAAAHHDLLIDLDRSEEQILGGFDKEIRRQIRKATEAGYEIRFDDSEEAMKQAWPLLVECGRRKGFHLQKSLEVYLQMLRLARPHGCVRIYQCRHAGKPVQYGLILRDRDRAWNLLLARDPHALQSQPSPGPLMHWQVMRDMRRDGVVQYNLGLAVGTVGRFKQQFHPRVQTYPPPVTLAINPWLYSAWISSLPVTKFLMPAVQRILQWTRRSEEQ